jgi:hypothetical protein
MTSSLSSLDNRFPQFTQEMDPKERDNTIFLVRQPKPKPKVALAKGPPLTKGSPAAV